MISTEWRITKITEETMTDLLEVFKDFNPQKMTNGQIRMECPFRENHPDGSGRMSFFVSPDPLFFLWSTRKPSSFAYHEVRSQLFRGGGNG